MPWRTPVLFTIFLIAFIQAIAFFGPVLGWVGGPSLCASEPCIDDSTFRPDPDQIIGWATATALIATALAATLLELLAWIVRRLAGRGPRLRANTPAPPATY